MPTLADMIVKKADAVTNITYTGLNPGSDSSPSLWKAPPLLTIEASRPWLMVATRSNGPKTARRVNATYMYPQAFTDTTTGLVQTKNQILMDGGGLFPLAMTPTEVSEAVNQFFNLLTHALMKSVFASGYNAS